MVENGNVSGNGAGEWCEVYLNSNTIKGNRNTITESNPKCTRVGQALKIDRVKTVLIWVRDETVLICALATQTCYQM